MGANILAQLACRASSELYSPKMTNKTDIVFQRAIYIFKKPEIQIFLHLHFFQFLDLFVFFAINDFLTDFQLIQNMQVGKYIDHDKIPIIKGRRGKTKS
ncbi:MAG TPA: hypothetical protein DDE71_06025 [Tenacibaculum sp.]|nr:hypothetical protein [Tenacibaculum sp.]